MTLHGTDSASRQPVAEIPRGIRPEIHSESGASVQPADLILGTAGHIDHGKTSLVRALSGVDTDRLAEEKERGITIELGFAPYAPSKGCSFGVVDVPGHEGFVRTMVSGATGMDIVLLVVAADESVMPQTREHLAIVTLLGVADMVVAVTKTDLVDAEWLELVTEDMQDLLEGTPYQDAGIVPVSVKDPASLERLSAALVRCAALAAERVTEDLFRLPVDRVFAVGGAGTVATGTLWSGTLSRGDTVRILPGGHDARVRAVQVHGTAVGTARAGQRTAAALTGAAVRRGMIGRGDVLVTHPSWSPSMMLTVELTALHDSGWRLKAGQRVRVHLATVEVMARVALFGIDEVVPGTPALAQLRLEGPVVARCGDRFVIRSYSPVTTIAGGVVVEPVPPKRKRLSDTERRALEALSQGGSAAVRGAAALAGWTGLDTDAIGVTAGWTGGEATLPGDIPIIAGSLFDPAVVADGEERLLASVERHHRDHSLQAGLPLSVLRSSLPSRSHPGLADGLAARLTDGGRLVVEGKVARLPYFAPALSPGEAIIERRLMEVLSAAGLQGPATRELVGEIPGDRHRTEAVLAFLEAKGRIRLVGDAFWVTTDLLNRAAARVVERFRGRSGLGPADFRQALPVTRKHLIPLLAYLDGTGVTERTDGGRRVAGQASLSATVPGNTGGGPGV